MYPGLVVAHGRGIQGYLFDGNDEAMVGSRVDQVLGKALKGLLVHL